MVRNLQKARQKWAQLTRVLVREGVDACTLGQIYLAMVQSVLVYGLETWVMTPHIGRVLGGFHTLSLPYQVCLPISLRATLWWNPPNTLPMCGVITHVSNPYTNTDCTIAKR